MPKCAFLTIENLDGWFVDDDIVHAPLNAIGWEVDDVVWNSDANWDQYDVVVIRSPWDYQSNLEQFRSVLQQIESSTAALTNCLKTVNWNIDKNYLFELQQNGVEIVPTKRFDTMTDGDMSSLFQAFGTDMVVVKPTIGANADDTFKIYLDTPKAEIETICESYSSKPCFAQPFVNSIVDEGEFSLIYFDGKFSHSIIKTTKPGDFRVQEEHGGGVLRLPSPEPTLVAAADKVMSALPVPPPLYARVDLVRTDHGSFALMEVELIEPCLYFRFSEQAASSFARTIDRRFR